MISETKNSNILLIFDDVISHNFKEKKVFDLAGQPFSPINIMNEVYTRTGSYENYTLTSIALLDTDNSSLMFKLDEMNLETNVDSLADQIINFNSEESRLTK
jgi:hypothetical protein